MQKSDSGVIKTHERQYPLKKGKLMILVGLKYRSHNKLEFEAEFSLPPLILTCCTIALSVQIYPIAHVF